MTAHAVACAGCAASLGRVRARIQALRIDAEHAPIPLLERWIRAPRDLALLERELLRRHVTHCAGCRADVVEMARLLALPLPAGLALRIVSVPGPDLLAAVAAMLAVAVMLFTTTMPSTNRIHAPPPTSGGSHAERSADLRPMPSTGVEGEGIRLREIVPGDAGRDIVEASLPGAGAAVHLWIPPLPLDERTVVLVRICQADGSILSQQRMEAGGLREGVVFAAPALGWREAVYRIEVRATDPGDSSPIRLFEVRFRRR